MKTIIRGHDVSVEWFHCDLSKDADPFTNEDRKFNIEALRDGLHKVTCISAGLIETAPDHVKPLLMEILQIMNPSAMIPKMRPSSVEVYDFGPQYGMNIYLRSMDKEFATGFIKVRPAYFQR